MNKYDERNQLLDRTTNWIASFDTKSSLLLTVIGISFSVLVSADTIDMAQESFTHAFYPKQDDHNFLDWLEVIMLSAFLILSAKSLIHIYFTLKARMLKEKHRQEGLEVNSSLFFMDIADSSYLDFKRKLNDMPEEQYLNELESQIFINSWISAIKYRNYSASVRAFSYSILALVIFLLLELLH